MLLPAAVAWLGALAGTGHGPWPPVVGSLVLVALVAPAQRRAGSRAALTLTGSLVVFGAVATSAAVRSERVAHNPLSALAQSRAGATLTGTVVDDPRPVHGRFGDEVLVRLAVRRVDAASSSVRLREPVLVFAPTSWRDVPLGSTVRVSGHLGPSTQGDAAAVVSTSASPDIRAGPDPWWAASGRVRATVRESVAGLPPDRRALVPALVDGDDTGLDPVLADDFRTTG